MAKRRGPGRPFKKGEGGRPKGIPNKTTILEREFSRGLLESDEYRETLRQRIRTGQLAPAVECMLWDRAYGKTKDVVAVETMRPLVIDLITHADGPDDPQ